MATIIQIKRSGDAGAPSTLKLGELAYSYYNDTAAGGGRLYIGVGGVDSNGDANDIVAIAGRYFTDMLDHTHGVLTASSAIITDASSKIDNLKVDNIDINGNTISSTDANGNIVLDPNGTGSIDVSSAKIINVATPTLSTDAANKGYVDTTLDALALNVKGDSAGSTAVDLSSQTLAILGGTGINTRKTSQTITVEIDKTGVTAGSYGGATAIPVLQINDEGQVTSATTATVASTLNLDNDSGSTGSVALLTQSLHIAGGEGIDVLLSGQTFLVKGEDASNSNKGVAKFDATNFVVTGGNVVLKDSSVANTQLVNSTVTIGTTTIPLGGTSTVLDGLTQVDIDNIRILNNTVASSTGVLYLDPNPIDSDGGDVIIRGSLTVQGTTTTVNSTTVSINDKNIVLADSAANAGEADGAGLTVGGALYSGTPATITYDGATDRWDFNKPIDLGFASLDSAVFINGVGLREAIEDDLVNNFFLAGEGIDLTYDDLNNTMAIAAEIATYTNLGVASFDSDQFTLSSGAVTISVIDGGTY